MTHFAPRFEELRQDVDRVLLDFLATHGAELAESKVLFDEIERMVRSGGKRIRPCFAYWGYRAAGRPHDDQMVVAAAALELLHTFALIHDDVMDGALERRGSPTVHAAHDVSTAILAGDLALVLADDLLYLFVCWELTSITSYLLIGFNHESATARRAARRS